MPIKITPVVNDDAGFAWKPGQSGSFPIRFTVEGLDATLGAAMCVMACQATDAVTGFTIPKYPTEHPQVAGFYVGGIGAKPWPAGSRTSAMVELTYVPPEMIPGLGTTIEIISASGDKVIARWPYGPQKGKPILVAYSPDGGDFDPQIDPASAKKWASDPSAGNFVDIVSARVLMPGTVLRITRTESKSPLNQAAQYRRHRNKSTWQGQPKGTWLCTRYDGVNLANGNALVAPGFYTVTYEFEADPDDQWNQYAPYIDRNTGRVPTDVDFSDGTNNGYTIITPYDYAEFNLLKLPSAL